MERDPTLLVCRVGGAIDGSTVPYLLSTGSARRKNGARPLRAQYLVRHRGTRGPTAQPPMSADPRSWWTAVLTYPPTWFAAGLLALLTVSFVVVAEPPTPMIVLAVVVAAAAAVAWPLAMSMSGTLTARRFAMDDVDDSETMAALAADLKRLDDSQPFEQLVALGQKRAALVKVLDRRLDPTEPTYSRYLTASRQVYRSALDNLREVAVANDSVNSIDAGYIERRLAELDGAGADSEAAQRERATLHRRADLRHDQLARISRLLAQNEAALTTLDRTTSALADVPAGQRPEDADEAMAALDDLSDRIVALRLAFDEIEQRPGEMTETATEETR